MLSYVPPSKTRQDIVTRKSGLDVKIMMHSQTAVLGVYACWLEMDDLRHDSKGKMEMLQI